VLIKSSVVRPAFCIRLAMLTLPAPSDGNIRAAIRRMRSWLWTLLACEDPFRCARPARFTIVIDILVDVYHHLPANTRGHLLSETNSQGLLLVELPASTNVAELK